MGSRFERLAVRIIRHIEFGLEITGRACGRRLRLDQQSFYLFLKRSKNTANRPHLKSILLQYIYYN